MIIRPATVDDAAEMDRIKVDCITKINAKKQTEEETQKSLERWGGVEKSREFIERESVFVAVDGAEIVGYVGGVLDDGKLSALFVDLKHHRKGAGSKILETFEQAVLDAGGSRVHLAASRTSNGFYEKRGYVLTGTTLAGGFLKVNVFEKKL